MRYILSLIVFVLLTSIGHSQILLLMEDATGGSVRDSVPTQFTFTDVTDVALSSYNTSNGVVLQNLDSCWVYADGDSFKIGNVGTLDVVGRQGFQGDTVYLTVVASGTGGTAVTSTLTAGGVSDTYSVTTIASSLPTPIARWIHNSGITKTGQQVTAWQDNIAGHFLYSYNQDTSEAPTHTDSTVWFSGAGTNSQLEALDSLGVFDFGTSDFSIAIWVYITAGSNYNDDIASKYDTPGWKLHTVPSAVHDQASFSLRSLTGTPSPAQIINDANNLKGKWVYLVVSFYRNVGIVMYEDGTAVTTENTTEWTDFSAEDIAPTNTFTLGKLGMGHIKSFEIYDSALTSQEVSDIYAEGKP